MISVAASSLRVAVAMILVCATLDYRIFGRASLLLTLRQMVGHSNENITDQD
jgi:hypothetical protein